MRSKCLQCGKPNFGKPFERFGDTKLWSDKGIFDIAKGFAEGESVLLPKVMDFLPMVKIGDGR